MNTDKGRSRSNTESTEGTENAETSEKKPSSILPIAFMSC